MPDHLAPGVYVDDAASGARPISMVGMSVAAIFGVAPRVDRFVGEPVPVTSLAKFKSAFINPMDGEEPGAKPTANTLTNAVDGFLSNGGLRCYVVNLGAGVSSVLPAHLEPLDQLHEISLLVAPGFNDLTSYDTLTAHCETKRTCFAILDTPARIDPIHLMTTPMVAGGDGMLPPRSQHGSTAVYAPWIREPDVMTGEIVDQPPSGHIAGAFARTDAMQGVHKAPANTPLIGATGLTQAISSADQAVLNPLGVNCIKMDENGIRIWGARTLADASSEMRYTPVRRTVTMVTQSIQLGTRWVVFEPNDETLWKSVRRDIGAFLYTLWRNGVLHGAQAEHAFYVKCGTDTMSQQDIDAGRLIAEIGVAVVKPAEFVVRKIVHTLG